MLARAIILRPDLVVADEPVSMLDMSVRAKVLQLMLDLRSELDLTYLYVTHDLATARFFCDRIAIMYLGRVVEIGPADEIYGDPKHPYTQALLRAIPQPDPSRHVPRDLPRGEVADAAAPPLGCSFHPRCPEGVRAVRLGEPRPADPAREPLGRRRPGGVRAGAGGHPRPVGALDAGHRPSSYPALIRPRSRRCSRPCTTTTPNDPLWWGVDTSSRPPAASGSASTTLSTRRSSLLASPVRRWPVTSTALT